MESLYAKKIDHEKILNKHRPKLYRRTVDDFSSSDSFELKDDDFNIPNNSAKGIWLEERRKKKLLQMKNVQVFNQKLVSEHQTRYLNTGRF